MKKRHARGEFKDQNKIRIARGTHNFVGDNNPCRKLSKQGKHHNQKAPWENTKTKLCPKAIDAWRTADKMYDWFNQHKHRKRGCSYKAMAKAFGTSANLSNMISKFRAGWIPNDDPTWLQFAASA